MKNNIKIILLCLPLFALNFSCVNGTLNTKESLVAENKIIFYREDYREYGWKEYDKDSVRFRKPMQIILDFYPLEYELRESGLSITKHKRHSPNEGRVLLFQQVLTKEQRKKFERVMREVNMEKVTDASSFTSTSVVDDGFRLQIDLTKDGRQEKFEWDNKYVEDLVKLLSIANSVAPEKYKFYKDDDSFVQSLKDSTK